MLPVLPDVIVLCLLRLSSGGMSFGYCVVVLVADYHY